jgi:hypothetical protein
VSEDVAPATFTSHPLTGEVPAGTAKAEVHISLSAGTSLAVNEVSLLQPKTVSVPVLFVAQSPGQGVSEKSAEVLVQNAKRLVAKTD